jgi:hypothetical protein
MLQIRIFEEHSRHLHEHLVNKQMFSLLKSLLFRPPLFLYLQILLNLTI